MHAFSSEDEDDPHCSSGEDWQEEEKKRNKRRLSSRLSKKPRIALIENFTSDEESEEEFLKSRNRNGIGRKTKVNSGKISPVYEPEDKPTVVSTPIQNSSKHDFASGSFVISKADAQSYDSTNPPHIWRIDGKALLQKFEPYEEDGEVHYKNTSIYTGWSALETDKYALLKDINFISNVNQKVMISFDTSQFKDIINDSD